MRLKSFAVLSIATVSFCLASCSGKSGPSEEIQVIFRDRTEQNSIEGEFSVTLNNDVAQRAVFESLITFPTISKFEPGDIISFEFFDSLRGVLNLEVLKSVKNSRIVIEVFDKSINLLPNEAFRVSGEPIKRDFVDKEAAFKNLLRKALDTIQAARNASVDASLKNQNKSSDSLKTFNSNFKARIDSLESYIRAVQDFIYTFPEFSEQSEVLLSLLRKQDDAAGLASVANSQSDLNRQIDAYNGLISPIEDAEFRLFTAIRKSLK